jgi:hypothetical protein
VAGSLRGQATALAKRGVSAGVAEASKQDLKLWTEAVASAHATIKPKRSGAGHRQGLDGSRCHQGSGEGRGQEVDVVAAVRVGFLDPQVMVSLLEESGAKAVLRTDRSRARLRTAGS